MYRDAFADVLEDHPDEMLAVLDQSSGSEQASIDVGRPCEEHLQCQPWNQ